MSRNPSASANAAAVVRAELRRRSVAHLSQFLSSLMDACYIRQRSSTKACEVEHAGRLENLTKL